MSVNRRRFFGLFGAAAVAPSVLHPSEARSEPERVVNPPDPVTGINLCSTGSAPIIYCSTSDE